MSWFELVMAGLLGWDLSKPGTIGRLRSIALVSGFERRVVYGGSSFR